MADEKIFGESWGKTCKGFMGKWADDEPEDTKEDDEQDDDEDDTDEDQ